MSSLLPPNATKAEQAVDAAAAQAVGLPVEIGTLWNAQTCPAALLPWLAWALSVDVWRADWSEARKRAVIAAAPDVHRRKGTVAAVKAAAATIGARIEIQEWFETGGEPHTARAIIDVGRSWQEGGELVSDQLLLDLQETLAHVAPARTHITAALLAGFERPVHVAAVVQRTAQIETFEFEEAA